MGMGNFFSAILGGKKKGISILFKLCHPLQGKNYP